MTAVFKTAKELIIDEGAIYNSDELKLDRQSMLVYLEKLYTELDEVISSSDGIVFPDIDSYLQFKIARPKLYTMDELEVVCNETSVIEEFKVVKKRLSNKLKSRIMHAMFTGLIKDSAGKVALQGLGVVTSAPLVAVGVNAAPVSQVNSQAAAPMVNVSKMENNNRKSLGRLESLTNQYIEAEEVE